MYYQFIFLNMLFIFSEYLDLFSLQKVDAYV